MFPRHCYLIALLAAGILTTGTFAQSKPPATAPSALGAVVEKEARVLTSDDFPEREAALKRLQGLVAEQLKQRAAIQDVLAALQNDLARQQAALAVVSPDEEAQAQIAGLLEMERGLAGWTAQTMAEPIERRKKLLDWGLSQNNAPLLARAYAESKRSRLDGIKQLAKSNDETGGINWTLSRLINDRDTPVRAAAMAAAWGRKPSEDVVTALWYRAVAGPLTHENSPNFRMMLMMEGDMGMGNMLKVDFPGGDPMEFDDGDESGQFGDAQLASDVLIHFNSPLVAEKVKALVAERLKAGKNLCLGDDPEWALVSHRLVETYAVKEALPILAGEALGPDSEQMGGDMNGRPFAWSRRTVAIGTLAKLIGKDPSDFDLIKARDMGNPRGWMWACDMDQQAMMQGGMSDGVPVRAFYAFWKDHHAEYGIKEEPSGASVPPPPGRGRGRGRPGGGPIQVDPPVQIMPAPNGKFPLNPNAVPDIAPAPAPVPITPFNAPANGPADMPLRAPAVQGRAAG